MSDRELHDRELAPDDAQPQVDAFGGSDPFDAWGDGAGGVENLFASEIAGLDASEWDVDAASIWGDDGASAGDGPAFDLLL